MQEQIDNYLNYLQNELSSSQNTVAAYRNDLKQFYRFILEPTRTPLGVISSNGLTPKEWSDVTRTNLVAFLNHLGERQYTTTSIARKAAAVKSFFRYLTDQALIRKDPTERLEPPKVRKAPPRSLTPAQVKQLLALPASSDRLEALRDNAMLQTLYATGMRVSEMVALNVVDVDQNGTVRCIGRGGRERLIPLGESARQALDTYLNGARNTIVRSPEEQALFVNHRGVRLTRQGFWLILKNYARKAGLSEDITPQTLRHSVAVHLLDNNADLKSIQELLGHASITTTQIYVQVAADRRQEKQVPAKA
jgi:integrase/recombinase XerD